MKKILSFALAGLALMSCTSNKTNMLIVCYSQTGTTKALAEEVQKYTGADIEYLQVENDYTGTYGETIARCLQEQQENVLPTVKPLTSDLSKYDIVFLAYPVWFGTAARPVLSLVENEKFAGKKVVTLCTFGSGGTQTSTADIVKALPDATVEAGFGIRTARIGKVAEVFRFLVENGYADGEVQALPAFMEHHPVSAEEASIFDQACSGYQFPLGTPVDVAVRANGDATEYEFTTDGGTTIYVTAEQGSAPEFTQVVR